MRKGKKAVKGQWASHPATKQPSQPQSKREIKIYRRKGKSPEAEGR